MGCGQGRDQDEGVMVNRNDNEDEHRVARREDEDNKPPARDGGGHRAGKGQKPDDPEEPELAPLPPIPIEGYWSAGAVEPGANPHCTPLKSPYSAIEKIPADPLRAKKIVYAHLIQSDLLSLANSDIDKEPRRQPSPGESNKEEAAIIVPRRASSGKPIVVKKMDIPRIVRKLPVRGGISAPEVAGGDGDGGPTGGDGGISINGLQVGVARTTFKLLTTRSDDENAEEEEEGAARESTTTTHTLSVPWVVGRAFLPHSFVGNSAGWIKVEVPEGKSVYSVQVDGPVRSEESKKEEQEDNAPHKAEEDGGGASDKLQSSSSTTRPGLRKYTLYPDTVEDVGLFLTIGGVSRTTNRQFGLPNGTAPIPGAFFTFRLGGGAPAGSDAESEETAAAKKRAARLQLETSLSLPLFPPLHMLSLGGDSGDALPASGRVTPGSRPPSSSGVSNDSESDGECGPRRLDMSGGDSGKKVSAASSPHSFSATERRCWLLFREAFNQELKNYLDANQHAAAFEGSEDRENAPLHGEDAAGGSSGVGAVVVVVRQHIDIQLSVKFRYNNQRFRLGTGLVGGGAPPIAGAETGQGAALNTPRALLECSSGLFFEDTSREATALSVDVAKGSFTLTFESESTGVRVDDKVANSSSSTLSSVIGRWLDDECDQIKIWLDNVGGGNVEEPKMG